MTPEPEWVDLGLPSGLLWARWNLGAHSPSEVGDYFSWANLDGHAAGTQYDFSQEVYNTTPGAQVSSVIPIENDAAREYLGTPWRIPTNADFEELNANCAHRLVTFGGIRGMMFTSNINGKTLFFPAGGVWFGPSILNLDSFGHYWSINSPTMSNAYNMYFTLTEFEVVTLNGRQNGFPIRAVREA